MTARPTQASETQSSPAKSSLVKSSLAQSFSDAVIRFRYPIILLNIVLVVLMAAGMPPKFSTDYRMFFSDDNELLANFEALERTYTKNDNIHFLLEAKDGNVFTPEVLAAVGEFTDAGWKLPYAMRVDSVTNFQDTKVNGDDVDVDDLIPNPESVTVDEAKVAAKKAFAEPRLVNRLLSEKGHVTGVNITLQLPDPPPKAGEKVRLSPQELAARDTANKPADENELVFLTREERIARDEEFRAAGGIATNAARELLAELEPKYAEVIDFRLVGMTPFNQSFTEASQKDISELYPLVFLLMFVLLIVLLRNVFATLITFVVIGFSIAFGLGGAAWIGIPLSPPATASIMIIMTLAIAHCVHLFIAILYGMRRGENIEQAVRESLRINAFPILLTSVTTLIGFLFLNTSDAPPFADLGNIVAIGIVGSLIFALTLLPALILSAAEISDTIWKANRELPAYIRWLPWLFYRSGLFLVFIGHLQALDFGRNTEKDPRKRQADLMDRFANFVVRRKRALLIVMAIIVVPLVGLSSQNNLDDIFMKYFAKSMEIRQDAEFVLDNYTGFDGLVYSLEAGDEEYDIADPEFLQKVEAFAQFWRNRKNEAGEPDTVYVTSFTDTMKKLTQDMVGLGDESYYRLPEDRAQAAALLTMYQMSLPQGLDLNNELNQNQSSIRFTVIFGRVSSKGVAERAEIGAEWLRKNWPTQAQLAEAEQLNLDDDGRVAVLNELVPPPNGTSMMFADISERNIKSMVWGSVGALVLISIILMFALRSFKLGLVSLIPNLVPAGMAFGIWALTGQNVTVALSVVLGMTLGIVVDDTVHFLNAYLRAKREQGKSSDDAVRYAFSHVGKALWVTSLVLIIGFGVLSFSAFSPNADMGLLTAITIGMAIVADFLLLPPLLMYLDQMVAFLNRLFRKFLPVG